MKTNLKKSTVLFAFLFILIALVNAQQPPTGTPMGNPNYNDWYRGGNNGNYSNPNIFGTFWPSPIYTYTNSINRTRLNGTLTTPINGVNQNVSGYMGIAPNGFFANNSPWSLLHLEGRFYNKLNINNI